MRISYGKGFEVAPPVLMVDKVKALQVEMSKLPQYEPETKHYFHAGMYCREVFRHAGVTIVGKVHKKEHFYVIASGTVVVTTDDGMRKLIGPAVVMTKPGSKRAVHAITDATCMTFHVTKAKTPEEAEIEMVEHDPLAMLDFDNKVKKEVLL